MALKGLKIKPISNVAEAREVFQFFKSSFFHMVQTETSEFLPLNQIYQAMVENLFEKRKIQFFAQLDEKVVGCAIATPSEESGSLFLPVLAVDDKLRGAGIASELLAFATKAARKAGYHRLKIKASYVASGFFVKSGFSPYLYVETFPPYTFDDLKEANSNNLIPVDEHFGKSIKMKFIAPNYDEKLAEPFKKALKDVKHFLYYEKRV